VTRARLEDKVTLVTGGAQGLGRAMCERLGADGARVIVADLQADKAQLVATEVGEGAVGVHVDVTDPDSCRALADTALERFGRIDGLVNNAGLLSRLGVRSFDEIPPEEWRRSLEVNLSGAFYCAQAVAPAMRRQQSGRIVNIASDTTLFGLGDLNYLAAKAGILGLTRGLARELGDAGVSVNSVMPGHTETEIKRDAVSPEAIEWLLSEQALHRPNKPDDIAAAVAFLLSDDARQITGSTIVVNAGSRFL